MSKPQILNPILEKIGGFGKWQIRQALILYLVTMCAGIGVFLFGFVAFDRPYSCSIPLCDSERDKEHLNTLSRIKASRCSRLSNYNSYSNCKDYVENFEKEINNGSSTTACSTDEIIFNKDIIETSIQSEFGFVCGDHFKRSIYGSLYMGGMLTGSILIGLLSDLLGRKFALVLSIIILSVSGVLSAVVPGGHQVYGFFRFLSGIGGIGCFIVPFVIVIESVTPKYAIIISTIAGCGFTFGELVLTLEAYLFRDWYTLQLVAHAPMIILVLVNFILDESPRWLIAKNRFQDAYEIIKKIARINSKNDNEIALQDVVPSQDFDDSKIMSESLIDMIKYKSLIFRCIAMCYQWFSVTMCYYGVSFYSTRLLGSPYLNFTINALIEYPAALFCLFTINRLGRKPILTVVQGLSGVACIAAGLLSLTNYGIIQKILAVIGKFGATAAFVTVYIYTSELYPTQVRNSVVGLCSMIARFGGIVAPYGIGLYYIWKPAPLVLFGCFSVVAGITAFVFPETNRKKLPENFQDAVDL